MSNDLTTTGHDSDSLMLRRNNLPTGALNAGAVAIESDRATAEALGQIALAKKFPRDLAVSEAELMQSCSIVSFASVAFYSVPRGASKITGESIRMAEELARVYGNFEFGHRELSRSADKSEVEVYAWDKEKNNQSKRQITVMHVLDTREGPRKLRDQKDVDDKIANVASKQVRGRILALMPKWLVEAAKDRCKQTLLAATTAATADAKALAARVAKIVAAFGGYKVTAEQLDRYLEHPVATATADDIVELQGIYNALRDGANPADYFGGEAAASADAGKSSVMPSDSAGKQHPATAAAASKTKAKPDKPAATETPPAAEQAKTPEQKPAAVEKPVEKTAAPADSSALF